MRPSPRSRLRGALLAGLALTTGCASPLPPASLVSREALAEGELVRTASSVPLAPLVLGQAEPRAEPRAGPRAEPRAEPRAGPDVAALFSRMGCALCHARGARYHDSLARSAARSDAEVARWIRNPEKFAPGTPMPTYASLVDEASALALARWIRAGGASK